MHVSGRFRAPDSWHLGPVIGSGLENTRPRAPYRKPPGFRLTPGIVDGEVGDVPIGDEIPRGGETEVIGELTEDINGSQVVRFERDLDALILLVGHLAAGGAADA